MIGFPQRGVALKPDGIQAMSHGHTTPAAGLEWRTIEQFRTKIAPERG